MKAMKYSYNVDPLLFGSVERSPYRFLPQSYRNENCWKQHIVQHKKHVQTFAMGSPSHLVAVIINYYALCLRNSASNLCGNFTASCLMLPSSHHRALIKLNSPARSNASSQCITIKRSKISSIYQFGWILTLSMSHQVAAFSKNPLMPLDYRVQQYTNTSNIVKFAYNTQKQSLLKIFLYVK